MGYARRRLGGNDEKRKLEDAGVAPAGFDVEVELTAETDGPVALTQEAAGSNSFPGLACAILLSALQLSFLRKTIGETSVIKLYHLSLSCIRWHSDIYYNIKSMYALHTY